jgi:hypothetical protein
MRERNATTLPFLIPAESQPILPVAERIQIGATIHADGIDRADPTLAPIRRGRARTA